MPPNSPLCNKTLEVNINLKLTLHYIPGVLIICILFSVCASIFYISRRRKRIKKESGLNVKLQPYSISQKFGILGIILFMLPIFLTLFLYLSKAILILFSFFFRMLHVPEILYTTFMYIVIAVGYSFIIIGAYLLCEIVWPKRNSVQIAQQINPADCQGESAGRMES